VQHTSLALLERIASKSVEGEGFNRIIENLVKDETISSAFSKKGQRR
jgi:hypothetical protein